MEIAVKNTEVKVPEKQILRYHQREDHKDEIDSMKGMMSDPLNARKLSADRGEVTRRIKRLEETLATQSPPVLSGAEKDKLVRRSHQLEEKILPGMLSQEEMRKNPAGSVGKFMRHEKAVKSHILEWKNIQLMLEPESNDPDIANIERLRPSGAMDRFRTDAQITGHMTYGNIPEEKWPFEAPKNTALEQAKRVSGMSPENRKKAGERMKAARLAKKNKNQDRDMPSIQEGEAVPTSEA
jgi:hypothetical protein